MKTAYLYLKNATKIASRYSPAWGNLGILFEMTDSIEQAQVIKRELDIKRQSNLITTLLKAMKLMCKNFIEKRLKNIILI